MAKKPKKGKVPPQKLKKDLQKMTNDWEELSKGGDHVHDSKFLKQMAKDIIELEGDARSLEEDGEWEDTAHIIHHILATPWGAPFVSDTTLLDAALNFDDDDEMGDSALCHLMEDFARYGHQFENQIVKVFEDLLDECDSSHP